MAIRPVVFIGVGGSGNKTLRTLRQSLMRRLKQGGWKGDDLPECWQLLAIDTVTTDSPDGYPAPLLPESCYLGLVPRQATYNQIITAMVQNTDSTRRQDAFAGWLSETLNGNVAFGAGANRAVGRAISAANLGRMKDRIQDAYQTAKNATQDLALVGECLKASGTAGEPGAFIITSLSGGTGSGMFLDVIEAAKAVDHEFGKRAQVILYGPDIFDPLLVRQAGAGIPSNTLASVMEITGGIWRDEVSEGTEALYQGGGLGQALNAGRPGIGSFYNYVIGATNARGEFVGNMDQAYRATGDSLTALVADDNVVDKFNAFFRINVFDNSWKIADRSGLKPLDRDYPLPFGSFGSARVSLGMEAFVEYSSEVVARRVVEDLLFPQFHQSPPGKSVAPQVLIQDAEANAWNDFLTGSGLNERAPADDVVDAIKPVNSDAEWDAYAAKVVAGAAKAIGAKGIRPDEMADQILKELTKTRKDFLGSERVLLVGAATEWAGMIEKKILRHVGEHASRLGLSVAAKLVEHLRGDCALAADEVRQEAVRFRTTLDQLPGQLRTDLAAGGLTSIPDASHPNVKLAQRHLAKAASWLSSSQRYELAADLIEDISANILKPIEDALGENREALLKFALADKTADGRPNPWHAYPRLGDRPAGRFLPGPTEFLLIDPVTYPSEFERRVKESLLEQSADQWFVRVCTRSVLGVPLDERGNTLSTTGEFRPSTFLSEVQAWMPAERDIRWGDDLPAARRAQYTMPHEPFAFAKRAKALIEDPETALGKFVSESLQHYLSVGDTAERTRRQESFASLLREAFSFSAPLANVNKPLASVLHPDLNPSETFQVVSRIPASAGTPLYDLLKNSLAEYWNDDDSPGWFGVTTSPHVDVFQALPAMHAMVFNSLMSPIHVRWQQVRADRDMRTSFWSLKRARPLSEALPISDIKLPTFIRGWALATYLNLRREDASHAGYGLRVDVWDAEASGDRWVSFPHPLLGFGAEGRQLLPAVLKSLGLAMVEANAKGSLAPLRPYSVLLDIGEDPESILRAWLREGVTLPGAPHPDMSVAGPHGSTGAPEDRRTALVASIGKSIEGYERAFAQVEESRTPFVRDPSWELRSNLLEAYKELRVIVAQFELDEVKY